LFSGLPTTFVRLSGCNLSCEYCDTSNSIAGDTFVHMAVEEVVERVVSGPYDVCITGGEPLLQQEQIVSLLSYLSSKRVSIETNGSISIKYLHNAFPKLFFSMDWKTPSSKNISFDKENLKFIKECGWIKFVVGTAEDLRFVEDNLEDVLSRGIEVILSPVFSGGESLYRQVCDFIMRYQKRGLVRMQIQLHKIVGIN